MSRMEFNKLVDKYTSLSDELTASSKTIRELRAKAKTLGESILEFMKNNDIEEVEVAGKGKLSRKTSKRTGPINKDLIAEELRAHLPPGSVPEIIDKIMNRRETSESTTLKRVKT
jgi:uncharacterized coiled-coil DUF342 family protein